MPVLRHEVTGLNVTVSDERAGRLGSEWVAEKPKPAPRSRKPKNDSEGDSED